MKREEALEQDFAVYNGGDHICLNLGGDPTTISVRTPDGHKVTFAFTPRPEGEGYQCVDIQSHSGPKNAGGIPLQTVALLGQGPTVAVSNPKDEVPTTVIALNLPKKEDVWPKSNGLGATGDSVCPSCGNYLGHGKPDDGRPMLLRCGDCKTVFVKFPSS